MVLDSMFKNFLEQKPFCVMARVGPESATGFAPVRKRWVVERTNAWEGRSRRNSKDDERLVSSSEAILQIRACHLMLRRMAPKADIPKFRYREAKLAV